MGGKKNRRVSIREPGTSMSMSVAETPKKQRDPADGPELSSYGSLFQFADGGDKMMMFIGGLAALANGAGMPAFCWVFGRFVKELAENAADVEDKITTSAIYMVIIGAIVFVLSAIQVSTWMIAAERQNTRLRQAYFDALLRQDAAFFDTQNPSKLATQMLADTRAVKNGINDRFATGIMNFGNIGFGLALGFYINWKLTLVILATVPITAGTGIVAAAVVANFLNRSRETLGDAMQIAFEALQLVRTVQVYNGEEREVSKFHSALVEAGSVKTKHEVSASIGTGASYGVIFASYSLCFWFAAYLVTNGSANVGDVVTVFFTLILVSMGVGLLFPTLGNLYHARVAAHSILAIVDLKPSIDSRQSGAKIDFFKGKVEFKHVTFSYPGHPEKKLLHDMSLTIQAGETIAFSGPPGSGKSTVAALIQRLYDPEEGDIVIDGIELRNLQMKWWRDSIGVVCQDPELFAGSIADNIRVGKPNATEDDIRQALKMAHMHEVVNNLPERYDTEIGPGGWQLTAGQKQRIAIARAIVKRPKLLVLDEATSALDRRQEVEVQEALEDIMQNGVDGSKLTVIVIANRPATIQTADRIVYMAHDEAQGSSVSEIGTYEELVAKKGGFAMLAAQQLAADQAAAEDEEADTGANMITQPESMSIEDVNAPFAGPLSVNKDKKKKAKSRGNDAKGKKYEMPMEEMAAIGPDGRPVRPTLENQAREELRKQKVKLREIISLSKERTWAVLIGLLGSIIAGAAYPIYAIVIAKTLDMLGTKSADDIESGIWVWVLGFAIIGAGVFFAWCLTGFFAVAGSVATEKLRTRLLRNLLRQDQTFFDMPDRNAAALTKVIESDAEAVHNLWGPALGFRVQMFCNIIVGFVIGLIFSWKIALVIFMLIPIIILVAVIQQIAIHGFKDPVDDSYDEFVSETLTHINTVAAFNLAQQRSDAYREQLQAAESRGKRAGIVSGLFFGLSQMTFFGIFALTYWYAARLLVNGDATLSDILTASLSVLMGAMGAGEASGFAGQAHMARLAAKKVFSLMNRQPLIDPVVTGLKNLGSGATLDFHDVKFAYPRRPTSMVLRHFEETFNNAAAVGITGPQRNSRVAIVELLARFYDPTNGSIHLNDHDIRAMDLKAYRSELGVCFSDAEVFSGTVRDNIRYSRPQATEAEVHHVAKLASVHNDILSMTQGYNTEIEDQGKLMPDSFKQRVALARALLRRPRLLLLDDATNALDAETEANVMRGLEEFCRTSPTTIVMTADRVSTVRYADRIVVLNAGLVLEEGTHDELVALDGHYARRVGHAVKETRDA